MKALDIKGEKFNHLEVIERIKEVTIGGAKWKCLCVCGNYKIATASNLKRGIASSCGCMSYKGICGHANKKYDEKEASYRAKASNYKANAKKRGIEWELSIEYCIGIFKSNCFYCNSEPENHYNVITRNRVVKNKDYKNLDIKELYDIKYNGIDRVNNSIGYVLGNCVPCCTNCNTAKLNMSLDNFKSWIEKLIINYKNWKNI